MTDDDWRPRKLARLGDVGLAPESPGDVLSPTEPGLDPREIVARVFERPWVEEKSVVLKKYAPPVGSRKGAEIDLSAHNIAVAGKVTPELLLAILANVIATSPNAAIAVARVRLEVLGWTFETSTGERG